MNLSVVTDGETEPRKGAVTIESRQISRPLTLNVSH